MIQIWRLMKAEMSGARMTFGLIFLWMFGVSGLFAFLQQDDKGIRQVIFFSYVTCLGLNMSRPRWDRFSTLLPVSMTFIGCVRILLQAIAILTALAGAGLAASLLSSDPSILVEKLHWIFPLIVTITCLQWIWFDSAFATRSSNGLVSSVRLFMVLYLLLTSFGLGTGRLDGLATFLEKGQSISVVWALALVSSCASIRSFRRRLSYVFEASFIVGESTHHLVKAGRLASLTILFNQMISNWRAYVLSYAGHGALVWWLWRKTDAWDLDNPAVVTRIAATIIASVMIGAIVQAVVEGERPNRFQYLLLPVSASEVATFRINRALPYAIPPILFWFVVLLRESPGQLHGFHWSFLALLGWICTCEAAANLFRDLWPRFRTGSERLNVLADEWTPIGAILPLIMSVVLWCFPAMLSVAAPESIVGGLGRAVLWTPVGACGVIAAGVGLSLISVRTFLRRDSHLVHGWE